MDSDINVTLFPVSNSETVVSTRLNKHSSPQANIEYVKIVAHRFRLTRRMLAKRAGLAGYENEVNRWMRGRGGRVGERLVDWAKRADTRIAYVVPKNHAHVAETFKWFLDETDALMGDDYVL